MREIKSLDFIKRADSDPIIRLIFADEYKLDTHLSRATMADLADKLDKALQVGKGEVVELDLSGLPVSMVVYDTYTAINCDSPTICDGETSRAETVKFLDGLKEALSLAG